MSKIKFILGAAIAFCLLVTTSFAQQSSQLPNTVIQDLKGKKHEFSSVIEPGKVTLVSIWATWCMPCIKEIKNIEKNLATWQQETPEFNYMIISIDDSRALAQVKSMVNSNRWAFPCYLDPNSDLKRSLNFEIPPFTFIIDKEGKIAYKHSGYEEGGEFILYEEVKKIANEGK